ncbi:MAG TPA: RNA-binding protein [Thermoanaerobaculia bacterium]|nr:RNA-binding protein [Thermoanaerobaculia bacterium]
MKLYVGNLSRDVTDPQLNELGAPFGKLISAIVATDRATGTPRGFGFLEFAEEKDARAAIAGLDGRNVNGQVLKVSEARPRKDRVQY